MIRAYEEQIALIEGEGGELILMASRALAACATSPDDYAKVAARRGRSIEGHDHASVDVRGRRRYVNPGSLGCCDQARARFVIASFAGAEVRVERRWVEYDDAPLREAFARRRVPDRANLDRIFFGSRLGLRQDSP